MSFFNACKVKLLFEVRQLKHKKNETKLYNSQNSASLSATYNEILCIIWSNQANLSSLTIQNQSAYILP